MGSTGRAIWDRLESIGKPQIIGIFSSRSNFLTYVWVTLNDNLSMSINYLTVTDLRLVFDKTRSIYYWPYNMSHTVCLYVWIMANNIWTNFDQNDVADFNYSDSIEHDFILYSRMSITWYLWSVWQAFTGNHLRINELQK